MNREQKEQLIAAALAARRFAYAPYSNYNVGAALLTKTGRLYTGCNIENAAYGLSNCAERTALFKAISEGAKEFAALAVAVDGLKAASPCGACRQVLREFFDKNVVIYLVNEEGVGVATDIDRLLPDAFTVDYL